MSGGRNHSPERCSCHIYATPKRRWPHRTGGRLELLRGLFANAVNLVFVLSDLRLDCHEMLTMYLRRDMFQPRHCSIDGNKVTPITKQIHDETGCHSLKKVEN